MLCVGMLLPVSCKKYPQGPVLSLRSKKERVANTWKLDKLVSGGVDSTAFFNTVFSDYSVTLTKSGNYTIAYNIRGFVFTESGSWAFSSGKEDLQITPASSSTGTVPSPSVFQILKLYEKELWLRSFYSNGSAREYHFLPK